MPAPPDSGPGVMLASLTINLLSLALPLVILQVYDRILPNAALDTLALLIIGLCGVLLLDGFLRTARAYVTGWSAARMEHMAGCRAVDRMLASDIGQFEREPLGVHLDRFYAIDQLREYHAGQTRLVMIDLPFVVLFLALIWLIAGDLVALPITLLGILGALGLWFGLLLKGNIRTRLTLDDRRYSFIIEVLSRIQTVKLLAMEPLLQRRYERLQESGGVGTYKTVMLSSVIQSLGALFSSLVMVSVAAWGATRVIDGQLSIGALAACTLLAGRSVQPMLRGLGAWTQVQSVAVARERLRQLFAAVPESKDSEGTYGALKGAIELRGMSFGYEDEAPLFADVNLKIAPGEVIGITGDTGSGKTTLLMLLMGLLRPTRGQVLYDGFDAAGKNPYSLRRQIAFLPQNPTLFKGTILENLTMFREGEHIDRALEAAKLVGLHEKVHRLPAGYGTEVGDGAADQLPSGMRQMIAIVRALAGAQRIILFDEANTAFDSQSDGRLKQALAGLKGRSTMVLVSHRPSLLALADRVYTIAGGRLVERRTAPAAPESAAPAADQAEGGEREAGKKAS